MSTNAADLLAATLQRLEAETQRTLDLAQAIEALALASEDPEAAALYVLVKSLRERTTTKAGATAAQYGFQVALHEIVPTVRDAASDDPIVWLTGNSMMPPLREWGASETVWKLSYDLPDLWERYVEGLESKLDDEQVCMEAPEYDNALYAVDLRRFEHVNSDFGFEPDKLVEAETLQDEWRLRDGV